MNPNRREFLDSALRSSTLFAFAGHAPAFLAQTALGAGARRAGEENTVLVVVQLSGGNDGLNCVAPYADDGYASRRTTLRLKRDDVLRIDDSLGFHPEMKDCRRLFDEGCFSVVQGVGYPKSSRDHPAAERAWQGAMPDDPATHTGWVGRFADRAGGEVPGSAPAALVTPAAPPFSVAAERAIVPHVRTPEDALRLGGPAEEELAAGWGGMAAATPAKANPLLDFVRAQAVTASGSRVRLRAAAAVAAARSYPQTRFAQRLQIIAGLIRAETGFRIFYTELGGDGFGGFDNHANQKENHAALLGQFSGGVGAFLDDLRHDGLADRVLLMTISEFGRTVAENGRRGTDHGAAAPVFLAGGRVKPGLIGRHPSLSDLDQNALRFHTDFRSVYAAVLDRWLGCDSRAILGGTFEPAEIFI